MSKYSKQTILDLIPHRPPFLFVDKILEWTEAEIVTAYRFKEDEFFFRGHYPDRPIVPGVILCESAMQAGAVYLAALTSAELTQAPENVGKKFLPVVGRLDEVKFKKSVGPGDVIECEVLLKEKMARVYFLTAKITSGGALVARFKFACTYTESPES
ncbi:MAG: 3-hydroxyacyl-ACP dehydratase FabZ family protein [Thermoguttaceae bacterium]